MAVTATAPSLPPGQSKVPVNGPVAELPLGGPQCIVDHAQVGPHLRPLFTYGQWVWSTAEAIGDGHNRGRAGGNLGFHFGGIAANEENNRCYEKQSCWHIRGGGSGNGGA